MSTKPLESPKTDRITSLPERNLTEPADATILIVDQQRMVEHGFGEKLREHNCAVREAESGEDALLEVDREDVDLVVLDAELPDMNGFEVLETLREDFRLNELPVVMLTDTHDEKDVVQALQLGANDCLTKDTPFPIALARMRTQLRLRQARMQLVEMVHTDALTGVMNRRAFFEQVQQEHERFERTGSPYALLMLDIDHFKALNDAHGHVSGDRVLRAFSQRLESETRSIDRVARVGGEEFALLLPDTPYQKACAAAERIRTFVTVEPFVLEDDDRSGETEDVRITVSIGAAAQVPDAAVPGEQLMERADRALYEAKRDGRNCVRGLR